MLRGSDLGPLFKNECRNKIMFIRIKLVSKLHRIKYKIFAVDENFIQIYCRQKEKSPSVFLYVSIIDGEANLYTVNHLHKEM